MNIAGQQQQVSESCQDRFGSMDRASAWGLKGPGFYSGQGFDSGPVGVVQEAADQ